MRPGLTVRLLPPELPYAAVHVAFIDGGWSGGPATRTPPLVEGEPEVARYRRADAVLTYALDPVMFLRTVRTGAAPSALPDLPWVSPAEVLGWLATVGAQEWARERRLLGVVAASELGLGEAVPALRALALSADVLVGGAARRAVHQLGD